MRLLRNNTLIKTVMIYCILIVHIRKQSAILKTKMLYMIEAKIEE